MGTRHLIAVFADGEYRVAQYGQWDGYPEGQGLECLHFLRDEMNEKFKENVLKCSTISLEKMKKIEEQYNINGGMISLRDYDRFSNDYPQLSRDTGSEILRMIQNSDNGLELIVNIDFAADSLFCEYAYVIDLDNRTFEAYEGFNKTSLNESDRFFFLEPEVRNEYHPVKLTYKWSLSELPDDEGFINTFKEEIYDP